MRDPRVWLGAGALILTGCGARSISTSETGSETTATEAETGPAEPLEPPDCGSSFVYQPHVEGPLTSLAGTEPSFQLEGMLSFLDTQWYQPRCKLTEEIEGQLRQTEFHLDGLGGALIIQRLDDDPLFAQHCQLAPPEFFTGCIEDFDAGCAQLDNWFGPCTDEPPTCPLANDCGVDRLCPTVQLGEDAVDEDEQEGSVTDPSCVWSALRDAEQLSERARAVSTSQGWYYELAKFHLDASSRTVGVEHSYVDDVTSYSFLGRCQLRPASFFQACLDDPEGDPDCYAINTWFDDCIEAPQPCAE